MAEIGSPSRNGWLCLLLLLPLLLAGCGKKNAPIIGVVTNYGSGDARLAQLKGALYTLNPQVKISSLITDLESANVRQTAFLLDQAVVNFPGGGVFIVAVDSDAKPAHPPVLVRTRDKKFYAAPDNGVLSFVIAREGLDRAWVLDKPEVYREGAGPNFFEGPDILAPVAARLAAHAKPDDLGTPTKTIELLPINPPHTAGQTVGGEILYIDSDGNLITNIPARFASWLTEGNLLKFTFGKQTFTAPLVDSLTDIKVGRAAAIFSSQDRLQIIVNKGSAARIYNASVGDTFTIHP